jgi:hypothetical protein
MTFPLIIVEMKNILFAKLKKFMSLNKELKQKTKLISSFTIILLINYFNHLFDQILRVKYKKFESIQVDVLN